MVCYGEISRNLELLSVITMGFSKPLVTESKVFSLSKEGSFLLIIERSWKVMNMRLSLSMVQWLAKALVDCMKGVKKDFYTMVREGNRSNIVQQCLNT